MSEDDGGCASRKGRAEDDPDVDGPDAVLSADGDDVLTYHPVAAVNEEGREVLTVGQGD